MIKQLLTYILLLSTYAVFAQFTLDDMKQYQYGNTPGYIPEYQHSYYEQLDLQYRLRWFRFKLGLEGAYAQDTLIDDYIAPHRYQVSFRKRGLSIKIGTYYETIGNGLLVRGFEVKNAVFEDPLYRVKQGFYKDFLGAVAAYKHRFFSVKYMSGKSLNNQLPPFHDERRTDWVHAAEAHLHVPNQSLGIAYVYNTNTVDSVHYMSILYSGSLLQKLQYKTELVHRIGDGQFFSEQNSYGLYGSISYAGKGYGMSLEMKNYHNLLIGSGVGDPPTLVKEHSYRLLNRSTHVVDLLDEVGLQYEVFYKPTEKHMLTAHYSNAINKLYREFQFHEWFVEWKCKNEINELKAMFDYSIDQLNFENDRFAGGLSYSQKITGIWYVGIDGEYQRIYRNLLGLEKIDNTYVGIAVNASTIFSVAVVWEYTNDPYKSDDPSTSTIEEQKHYPGIQLSYQMKKYHSFQLFAGERLGGPACTAGICYEVPDFKGIELRWNLKI